MRGSMDWTLEDNIVGAFFTHIPTSGVQRGVRMGKCPRASIAGGYPKNEIKKN